MLTLRSHVARQPLVLSSNGIPMGRRVSRGSATAAALSRRSLAQAAAWRRSWSTGNGASTRKSAAECCHMPPRRHALHGSVGDAARHGWLSIPRRASSACPPRPPRALHAPLRPHQREARLQASSARREGSRFRISACPTLACKEAECVFGSFVVISRVRVAARDVSKWW